MARSRRHPPGDPRLAIAYVRVSTEEQRLGPEAQRSQIELWARREGVTVVAFCVDQGVSGAAPLEARPSLAVALGELGVRGAGVLVVAKRDRLARSVEVALERAVAAVGARVVSADGTGNGEGDGDILMRGVLDLVAQHERALIRARTRAALAAKKARGERIGSVPLGFRVLEGGKLEPDPTEQTAIDRMQRLRADGRSYAFIAARLSRTGPPPRSGHRWHSTQVRRALHRG